jgi:hypothetical protein
MWVDRRYRGIDAAQDPFAGDDMTLPGRPE